RVLLAHAGHRPVSGRQVAGRAGSPREGDGTGWRRGQSRLVLPGHGPLATGRPSPGPEMVRTGPAVDGEEPAAGRVAPALPCRSGSSPGAEEVTAIGLKKPGGRCVSAAKQNPHRPGTAPALGLRA